jgi:cell fate regulator YaaT (PSP1 superfamily)
MLNPATRLFIVEFKAGRTDLFFTPDPTVALQVGDLVIVEADRGQDLGKVKEDKITVDDVRAFNVARKQEMDVNVNGAVSARIKGALTNILVGEANAEAGGGPNPNPAVKAVQRELMPKRIFGKAGPADRQLLTAKLQDEAQALALCQQRVKQKRLPMEVLDAEYQW